MVAAFLAFKRTLDQLRGLGCGPLSTCVVYAQTDGEENVEPDIRAALAARSGTGKLPAALDNAGISVVICGLAQTVGPSDSSARRGRQTSRHADRVHDVWSRLFTNSGAVAFLPHCPGPTGPGA